MNPQVANSASPSSLRVCWSLFSDDTVDFYELYCSQISEDIAMETMQDGNHTKTFLTIFINFSDFNGLWFLIPLCALVPL